jgi:hypothetical protein
MMLGALAAALGVLATSALAAVSTGIYKGSTSQAQKVRMVVVPARVKSFNYGFHAACVLHSQGYLNTFIAHNVPIVKGHFKEAGTFSFTGPHQTDASAKVSITGVFDRPGHALGAFSVKLIFRNPDGSFTDRCAVSGVSWHARL